MLAQPIYRGDDAVFDAGGIGAFENIKDGGKQLLEYVGGDILRIRLEDTYGFVFGIGQVADQDVLSKPGFGMVFPIGCRVSTVLFGRGGQVADRRIRDRGEGA